MFVAEAAPYVFLASLGLSIAILLSHPLHSRWTTDPVIGAQKLHEGPALRVGGIAILGALWAAIYLLGATSPARDLLIQAISGACVAFAVGLTEDLSKRVSIALRFFAALSAALLAISVSGLSVASLGLGGWEQSLFAYQPVAIFFTAFAIAGIVNAFNIIDGVNGLAGATGLVVLCAVGLISLAIGDQELFNLCIVIFAAVLGFLIVNWPMGRLFLGDCGAYLLGFMLAWVCVLLPVRNPEAVSPWASLTVLLYPTIETLFTITRRRLLRRHPVLADKLHLHTLVKKRLLKKMLSGRTLLYRNSAAGLVCTTFSLVPALVSIAFYANQPFLIAFSFFWAITYIAIYRRLVLFRWI